MGTLQQDSEVLQKFQDNPVYDVPNRQDYMGGTVSIPPNFGNSIRSSILSSSMETDPYKAILTEMHRIGTLTDPEKATDRWEAVSQLSATADAHIAKATELLSKSAEGLYAVPALERALQENMAADRASPLWIQNLSDSNDTLQVRNELNTAREKARNKTADFIAQSPEIQSIQAAMKTFLHNEASIASANLQAGDKNEIKVMQNIARAGENGIQLAKILNANTPNMSDNDAAIYAIAHIKGDKVLSAMEGAMKDPAILVNIATTTGDPRAKLVVAQMNAESKASGNPQLQEIVRNQTKKDLNLIQEWTTTSEGRAKLEEAFYKNKPDTLKKDKEALAAELTLAQPKDRNAIETNFYRERAMKVLSVGKQEVFAGNIEGWNPGVVEQMKTSTKLSPIISAIKNKTGGQVSLELLAGNIGAIQDPVERSNAKNELLMYLDKASTYENSGIYGGVNTLELKTIVDRGLVGAILQKNGSSIGDYIERGANAVGGIIRDYIVQPTVATAILPSTLLTTPIDRPGYLRKANIEATRKAGKLVGGKE